MIFLAFLSGENASHGLKVDFYWRVIFLQCWDFLSFAIKCW